MGIFGRKKASTEQSEQPDETGQGRVVPPGEPGVDRDWDREVDGPFDISEEPEIGGRVDLGALRIPAGRGMELRLDVEKGSGRVVGVTLGVAGSLVQLQAFAAPRSAGLWEELRPEIAEGIGKTGGTAEEVDGVFGTELMARMPGRSPDGRVAHQPARFLGIDGPRWFLRAVIHGPAATDEKARQPLLGLLRMVVVDRGEEPRPPREVLTLAPPKHVVEAFAKRAAEAQAKAAGADGDGTVRA